MTDLTLEFKNKTEAMGYFIMVLEHICRFGEKDSEAKFFNPNKGAKLEEGIRVVWGNRK